MAVKLCNRPAVGAHRLKYMEFIDLFQFILTRISLLSQIVQKQTLDEMETKTLI